MSNQLFQQNLDDKKGPQPGGPYLIQMLFKEPVDMPDKETMTAVIETQICQQLMMYIKRRQISLKIMMRMRERSQRLS